MALFCVVLFITRVAVFLRACGQIMATAYVCHFNGKLMQALLAIPLPDHSMLHRSNVLSVLALSTEPSSPGKKLAVCGGRWPHA